MTQTPERVAADEAGDRRGDRGRATRARKPGTTSVITRRARTLPGEVTSELRGHDLLFYAAALTFYGAVAVVPLALLATKAVSLALGAGAVEAAGRTLGHYTPSKLGAARALSSIANTGARLSWSALVAVIPGSLYAEGLVRALDRLGKADSHARSVRGRLLTVALLVGVTIALAIGVGLLRAFDGGLGSGTGPRLLGILVAFVVLWSLWSGLLVPLYRIFGAVTPGWPAALIGGIGTASWLAGQTMGFLLVLRLATGVGTAYGGSVVAGALAVVAFLLYLDHIALLLGYAATLRLDRRHLARLVSQPAGGLDGAASETY